MHKVILFGLCTLSVAQAATVDKNCFSSVAPRRNDGLARYFPRHLVNEPELRPFLEDATYDIGRNAEDSVLTVSPGESLPTKGNYHAAVWTSDDPQKALSKVRRLGRRVHTGGNAVIDLPPLPTKDRSAWILALEAAGFTECHFIDSKRERTIVFARKPN